MRNRAICTPLDDTIPNDSASSLGICLSTVDSTARITSSSGGEDKDVRGALGTMNDVAATRTRLSNGGIYVQKTVEIDIKSAR